MHSSLAMFWGKQQIIRNALLIAAPIAVLLYGIYLTGSRGTLFGVLLLAFLGFRRISRLLAPVFAGGVGVAAVALGFTRGRNVSLSGGTGGERVAIWSDLLYSARQHPITGIGFGHVYDVTVLTAHNSYVLALVETGVIGYCCFVAFLVIHGLQLREVWRLASLPEEIRKTAGFLFASYASILLTSFFLSRTYAFTIYLFLGLVTGFALFARRAAGADGIPLFRGSWLVQIAGISVAIIGGVYILVRLHWGG